MIEILLFVLGLLLGMWWFTVAVLPIFYGLPKSTYWIVKGKLRPKAIGYYVAIPIFWNVFFLAIAIVIVFFAENVKQRLLNSPGFSFGQTAGVIITLFRAFTASGRKDLDDDFWSSMKKWDLTT